VTPRPQRPGPQGPAGPPSNTPTVTPASSRRAPVRSRALRVGLASALGVLAALLVSCGSTGKGLIPSANAGPLQTDFEAVSQAAANGNGNCAETESAIAKTEQDFNSLPVGVNAGLRSALREGIANLAARARALCAQPLGGTTTGTTAKTTTQTTPTETTPTVTQTTPTTPTTTTPTTPTTPGTGGGTPAPGEGAGEEGGAGGVGAGEGK
jgi:hypothetical protein